MFRVQVQNYLQVVNLRMKCIATDNAHLHHLVVSHVKVNAVIVSHLFQILTGADRSYKKNQP